MASWSNRRVVAIGGITMDYVRTTAGTVGPSVGGNALYAAVGAWLVGARAVICARLGADFPVGLLDEAAGLGLDTSLVRQTEGPSMRVLLDESSGERIQRYLPNSGSNDRLDPTPDLLRTFSEGFAAHVCGLPVRTQRRMVRALRGQAATVTLDTVVIPGRIEPQPAELFELSACCDAFLPSVEEVRLLWPGVPPATWIRDAASRACCIVVKLGRSGALGICGGERVLMGAASTRVVDATGAGDAYCGAFAATLGSGEGLRTSMAWAAAAASVVIEGYGALHALVPERRLAVRSRAEALLAVAGAP
jgi:sugar/nucleoside kinase (ribokinase family)